MAYPTDSQYFGALNSAPTPPYDYAEAAKSTLQDACCNQALGYSPKQPTTLERLHKSRAHLIQQLNVTEKAIGLLEKHPEFEEYTELKNLLQQINY